MFDVGDILLGNWTGERLYKVSKVNKQRRAMELRDFNDAGHTIVTDATELYRKKKQEEGRGRDQKV